MARKASILIAVLFVGQAAYGQQTTVTFQQGANGYENCVDNVLLESTPDADGCDATVLLWDRDDANTSGVNPIHPLLRFDGIFGEAAGQIHQNDVITFARLYLQVNDIDSGDGVAIHRMIAPWSCAPGEESTWNAMVDGIQPDGVEAEETPDDTRVESIAIDEEFFLDVIPSLLAWQQDPSSNRGWFLNPLGEDGVSVYSAEGLTPPMLVVTIASAVPAVGTWGIIIMATLVLGAATVVFKRLRVAT